MPKYIFDIDQTICVTPHDPGVQGGHDYSRAKPLPERIKVVNALFDEGCKIVYWTSRGEKGDEVMYNFTLNQLLGWGCKFTKLKLGKPKFYLFVDNHAVQATEFFEDPEEYVSDDYDPDYIPGSSNNNNADDEADDEDDDGDDYL